MKKTDSNASISKGLDAIFHADFVKSELEHQSYTEISLDNITPNKFQPREIFDQKHINDLADSIKIHGILQPILVRNIQGSSHEIIAGECRYRAAKIAGLTKVPVRILSLSDQDIMVFGIIENMQREDLNPIEESRSLHRLQTEFNLTHEEISSIIGKPRSTITNLLRLLKLVPKAQDLLLNRKIDLGHAKLLASEVPTIQSEALFIFEKRKATVKELEIYLFNLKNAKKYIPKKNSRHPRFNEWKKQLASCLPSDVCLKINTMGCGKISFNVSSETDVDWIIEKLSK